MSPHHLDLPQPSTLTSLSSIELRRSHRIVDTRAHVIIPMQSARIAHIQNLIARTRRLESQDVDIADSGRIVTPVARLAETGDFLARVLGLVPFPIAALRDDGCLPGCGAAPPFNQLAFVEEGSLRGEETADARTCVDEFGEVGLFDALVQGSDDVGD